MLPASSLAPTSHSTLARLEGCASSARASLAVPSLPASCSSVCLLPFSAVELLFQPTIVIIVLLSTEYAVFLMHIHPRLMRRPCIAGLAFVMILLLVLCWNRTDYKKSVENNVRFAMQCKRLWIVTLICESAALMCEPSDAPRHVRCQWDRQHADWLCASE